MGAAEIVWRHLVCDSEVGADRAHQLIEAVDGASALTCQDKPLALTVQLGQQDLRWFRKTYSVGLTVFRPRPGKLRHCLSRHLPPTAIDVLKSHVRDFAWPLAQQQNQLQRRSCQSGTSEGSPKQRELPVR